MDWGVNPSGLFEILNDVQINYGNPVVYITENGMAADDRQTKMDLYLIAAALCFCGIICLQSMMPSKSAQM